MLLAGKDDHFYSDTPRHNGNSLVTDLLLPDDPSNIDAEWLTQMLQQAGTDAVVTGFSTASIGTGQVGENIRFSLEGTGDLPETLVGKFPSPEPVSRQAGIAMLNYRREVHFYQHLQHRVNIQTPRVYHTDINDETHNFVLMMEDLAPGRQGDQLGGCDVESACLAMEQLAHLHGPVWGDTSLGHELLTSRSEDPATLKELYDTLSPGFLARYSDRLTAAEKDMVRAVGENLIAYTMNYQGPQTLIHIDYRLDNMMFNGPYPLTVVDWQSIAYGCGLNDASYFVGTSLEPSMRAENDEYLLRQYFCALTEYGADITWEECWKYYCVNAPAGLIMAVIASMIVGETPRGNDMFMAMAKRSAKMCEDLNAIDIIRQG